MQKLVECVPNFSEGRDASVVQRIAQCFMDKPGVKLLDYSSDKDHNRTVVTVMGEPEAVMAAVVAAAGAARDLIDLNKHHGEHPRMGAVDVIPFIPLKGMTMDEAVELSKRAGALIYDSWGIPVFLYENSATAENRRNLADIRKGEFEGMAKKTQKPGWKPDFGDGVHPTAGVVAVGARMPLIAFNVNLNTPDVKIADAIAKLVRHSNGGLRFVKAMGVNLAERGIAQVSMNLTDYTKTAIYRVFELIKVEAARYGVSVIGSEVIGLLPMQALADTAEYYLQIEGFNINQVLEARMLE